MMSPWPRYSPDISLELSKSITFIYLRRTQHFCKENRVELKQLTGKTNLEIQSL
jgi:hypothetical protein